MHDIEPFYGWEKYYVSAADKQSPFYKRDYDLTRYSTEIYGYYIHPLWDAIGSPTLYIKILYVNYHKHYAIIEMFGEWNDALNNDVMFLKRNIIEYMLSQGINQFVLIGENIFNFHGSDDCYYEEWFEEVEDGWIAAVNFRYFVEDEWKKFNIDSYINSGGSLAEFDEWRTMNPEQMYLKVKEQIVRRLG